MLNFKIRQSKKKRMLHLFNASTIKVSVNQNCRRAPMKLEYLVRFCISRVQNTRLDPQSRKRATPLSQLPNHISCEWKNLEWKKIDIKLNFINYNFYKLSNKWNMQNSASDIRWRYKSIENHVYQLLMKKKTVTRVIAVRSILLSIEVQL